MKIIAVHIELFKYFKTSFIITVYIFVLFQIKSIAVDEHLKVVSEENVKFDTDLPEFG